MIELNIKYYELYKKVDRFICDANGSTKGVTLYVEQMEEESLSAQMYVDTWNDDLKKLRRLRHIRNELSHDAGFDSDICEMADYEWLKNFYDRLMSASDPMAMLNKAKIEEKQRREEQKRRLEEERKRERQLKQLEQNKLQEQLSERNDSTAHKTDDLDVEIEQLKIKRVQFQAPKKKSFWQRVKDFFFG